MSNFREMGPQWLQNGCSENFKLLKYEHVIYHFKAHGLEISNKELLSRNIQISRFYEHFKKFSRELFCSYFREI